MTVTVSGGFEPGSVVELDPLARLAAQEALLKLGSQFGVSPAAATTQLPTATRLGSFVADSVSGGAATASLEQLRGATGTFRLGADSVSLAGSTASGVRAADPVTAQYAAHTVTLADKTTLNISGIDSHQIVKPS